MNSHMSWFTHEQNGITSLLYCLFSLSVSFVAMVALKLSGANAFSTYLTVRRCSCSNATSVKLKYSLHARLEVYHSALLHQSSRLHPETLHCFIDGCVVHVRRRVCLHEVINPLLLAVQMSRDAELLAIPHPLRPRLDARTNRHRDSATPLRLECVDGSQVRIVAMHQVSSVLYRPASKIWRVRVRLRRRSSHALDTGHWTRPVNSSTVEPSAGSNGLGLCRRPEDRDVEDAALSNCIAAARVASSSMSSLSFSYTGVLAMESSTFLR